MPATGRPLELILARNFLASLSTPAFLVDQPGRLCFYNDAAGELLGRPFEQSGELDAADWMARFGPLDDDDQPLALEDVPVTQALRHAQASHGRYKIRLASGLRCIEATAFPILGCDGFEGAVVMFWPVADA